MTYQTDAYITLNWVEKGPKEANGQQPWHKDRKVCIPNDYPKKLPCNNPRCKDGGFEIGSRIASLLASGMDSEQNSLICSNAIHKERAKRCLHTIFYSIAIIRPYQSVKLLPIVSDHP